MKNRLGGREVVAVCAAVALVLGAVHAAAASAQGEGTKAVCVLELDEGGGGDLACTLVIERGGGDYRVYLPLVLQAANGDQDVGQTTEVGEELPYRIYLPLVLRGE